jgi:glutaconyl-CoA/methylmalonyl-CoA decarboxylase subunit gamma
MPVFQLSVRGKRYRVDVVDPSARPLTIVVDGEKFEIEFVQPSPSAALTAQLPPPHVAAPMAAAPSPISTDSTQLVAAPMPGTLLSIEVSVGDRVSRGQVVCVLEAMKMKNPLRARQDGRVREICAAAGDAVTHGQCLVRLEDES